MNELLIKLKSGISADGFTVEIPGKFKEDFAYGYNVSYSRKFATQDKPYISDLIISLMKEYGIKPENVNVLSGDNTFSGNSISMDKVKEFEDKYFPEILQKYLQM